MFSSDPDTQSAVEGDIGIPILAYLRQRASMLRAVIQEKTQHLSTLDAVITAAYHEALGQHKEAARVRQHQEGEK